MPAAGDGAPSPCGPPVPAAGARVRAEGHRPHDRRRGRRSAGQRHARRRHLPHRHRAVGEAQHRARDSGVGRGALHPVRQVRAGLPARGDPRQGLRSRDLAGAPGTFKSHRRALEGFQGDEVHAAGRAGGLHRLRALRGGLPRQEQDRSQAQGHQHGAAAGPARSRERTTGTSSSSSRRPTAWRSASAWSRTRSCCSRSSSSPAPAPAAARRLTSS